MPERQRAPAGQRRDGAAPLVVAHRGAWGAAPQNSLEAFERAIALGCTGIEIDVRRTADGRLAVVHDARVGGRTVARSEHHRLQARMKAGQAPLLQEVLELVAGRVVLDVELKEDGYVAPVMAAIAGRLASDEYVVTSFHDTVLPQVKRCVPEARTGLLVGPRLRLRELDRRVRQTGVDFLAPQVALVRRGILGWAQARDLSAWLWTVNDPRLLRRLLRDERVAAVVTDKPERALGVFTSP